MASYSLTKAGYRAWLEDGNKGSFSEFLMSQKTREEAISLIEKKIAYLNTKELFDLVKYINKKYHLS